MNTYKEYAARARQRLDRVAMELARAEAAFWPEEIPDDHPLSRRLFREMARWRGMKNPERLDVASCGRNILKGGDADI